MRSFFDPILGGPRTLAASLLVGLLVVAGAIAQVSPEEHASHHSGGEEADGQSAESGGGMGPGNKKGLGPGAGGGGMMGGGGMGGMMEKMGAPKPKDLYPSLISLPELTPEKRAEIEEQARERMKTGSALLSEGLGELEQSSATADLPAMQAATARMREGLARYDSGLAARRALAEGKPPRDIALEWFKTEMSLPTGAAVASQGWIDQRTFHLVAIAILGAFAAIMIWMYFFKMKRASALLAKLAAAEPTGGAEAAKASPPTGPAPGAPAEAAPAAAPKKTDESVAATAADCCAPSDETCPTGEDATDRPDISAGLLPIRKKKLCRLRVARIDQETPDVKTFRLVACHDGGIPFSYLPGQFLTLTLPVGDKPIRRSYTISSSPTQGYYCEISVKREEHGAGSRYLHDEVKVGDTLEVQAPSGKFIFTGKEAEDIVLIGGGVGITPMMSVTRALTDMAWDGDIHFIVACNDPEHFIFESELGRLQQRHPNLHLFAAMSDLDEERENYRKGRLSRDLLAEWVPGIASKRIHICGPSGMMDAVRKMLAELGAPKENVHTENFGGEQKPQVRAEQRAKAASTDIAETGGTVTFRQSDKSTQFQPDETVLEASERVGVNIDYSCRVGMCGVCVVKLLTGKVSMEVEDGLDPDDKAAGIVLACQAKSTGDVAVDA